MAQRSGAEVVTSDGRPLPLRGVTLTIHARGGIARAMLEQRYENPHDEALRVTYRLPLPADGAVSSYAFEIGARRIEGQVDRRAAARATFERAIAAGHTAAILDQERADIFTQQLGNLPPRTTLIARIGVDLRLTWLPEGEWELRFPTVIGPRYVSSSGSLADVIATSVRTTPQGTGVTFGLTVTIDDALVDGRRPTSPTHKLNVEGTHVALADPAKLDRDVVIRWPVAAATLGMSVAVARPAAGVHAAHAYGLVSIVPPAAATTGVARDLLILLDTSGSMSGAPLDTAKRVLPLLIESLGEGDRLELIEFSNQPRRYKESPAFATAREKADAIKWIRGRTAEGGTEMRAAVIEALSTLRLGAQRQVVLVTDGYVGGEQEILAVLLAKLPRSCRLHVLGVGSAVNRALAIALARAGRGAEVLVGPDEDAERGAKRLLDRTKLPVLTNVELAGTALVRSGPEGTGLPDVFAGAPLVAAVALSPDGGELVVRGDTAGEPWEHRVRIPATRAGDGPQAIVALYGREHVADLETRVATGTDARDHERAIEETGVTFQLATRLTSWVAVDAARVVTGPVRDADIPQELPYGTHAAAFGLRPGAPPASVASFDAGDHDEEADVELGGGVFATEEPTGAFARQVAPASPPRPMAMKVVAPALAGKRAEAEADVASRRPTDGKPPALTTRATAKRPSSAPVPVPMKRQRGRAIATLVLALLALLALLWWLLA